MASQTSLRRNLSSSQVSVAAQAFAASQFALSGFDVLEQAGRARFYFDLAVARSGGMMKVSVHASCNGFWDLADRYLDSTRHAHGTAADYHRAIVLWLENHTSRVTYCFVQFEPADLHRMPCIYLASAEEVATHLHERINQISSAESGPIGLEVHWLEGLPAPWRFSQSRIAELMKMPAEETGFADQSSSPAWCTKCAASQSSACEHCMPMMN